MIGIDHRLLAGHQFAILNPLRLERQHWADLPVVSLAPPRLSSKAHAMPQLLDLATLSHERLGALLELADRWDRDSDAPFFSLLVRSESKAELIAAHLSRQLIVRAPDGSDALLRWFDPRVMPHLHWLLTPAQLHTISGPVNGWTWRDESWSWVSRDVPEPNDATARLRLDDDQWAAVGRLGVLNRTVRQFLRSSPALRCDNNFYRRIDTGLRDGYEKYGLVDEVDVRLFAEHGVRYPGIHARPEILHQLSRVRRGETSYVAACAGLDMDQLASQDATHYARMP